MDYNATQQDTDGDGIGDVCDPTDDRPVDTGGEDTADTAADVEDTGCDTATDTAEERPDDTALGAEVVYVDEEDPEIFKGGGIGCSTGGS